MALLNTLPSAPEETPWSGMVSLLRSNSVLQEAGVKVWTLADGPEFSAAITAVPNPDDMPVIRLRMGGYPMKPWTEHMLRGEWSIEMDLFTRGTDEVDQLRLFHAIRLCLKPTTRVGPTGSDAVQAAMDPNQTIVQHAEFTKGASMIVTLGQSGYCLKSTCSYRMRIQVLAT